jgi:hypothetical protein
MPAAAIKAAPARLWILDMTSSLIKGFFPNQHTRLRKKSSSPRVSDKILNKPVTKFYRMPYGGYFP